ncbi:hypothetical protein CXG81DRAFT_23797 [Caulochytrium protostelioides]|uniref:T-cell immunomodulatory protein TIP C2 domain-containing protein n=1 Tax=Caulochytrium protostelioides TaxID=1555241 RepID=A0A4P9XDF1_9FUNG|nr:hypothetical protein CXG81DRAFT_23797 [Caulochytrium protostelioides]|eukprot:RKP03536.1 hypothetical protein CXG81DRAFT_23797 [Caulochytrium protostelioides]
MSRSPIALLLIAVTAFLTCATTLASAKTPLFKYRGLHPLDIGLGEVDGTVVGFLDWNNDKQLDLLVLDAARTRLRIYLWQTHKYGFKAAAATPPISSLNDAKIDNVVISDFDNDGHIDILMQMQATNGVVDMRIAYSQPDGTFAVVPAGATTVPPAQRTQPFVADTTGLMVPEMIGVAANRPDLAADALSRWVFYPNRTATTTPLTWGNQTTAPVCDLPSIHSNAFVDLNGDCLPDLFLTCRTAAGEIEGQVWLNRKDAGFELARRVALTLPERRHMGQLRFADMDADGTLDIVVPLCASLKDGVGRDCVFRILYNTQKPICDTSLASLVSTTPCRPVDRLCEADDAFMLGGEGNADAVYPLADVLAADAATDVGLVLQSSSRAGSLPNPIRDGDVNNDRYPDLLFVTRQSDGATQAHLAQNTACSGNGDVERDQSAATPSDTSTSPHIRLIQQRCKAARAKHGRQAPRIAFAPPDDAERMVTLAKELAAAGEEITAAHFLDLDGRGVMDLLLSLHNSGTGRVRTLALYNDLPMDAFFLKAHTVGDTCGLPCRTDLDPDDAAPAPEDPEDAEGDADEQKARQVAPEGFFAAMAAEASTSSTVYGLTNVGATYKFVVFDTRGRERPYQAAQAPSSAYMAVPLPQANMGLSRTNNHIDHFYVGTARHQPRHFTTYQGIIPNSHLIIVPYQPPGTDDPSTWLMELYLNPSSTTWTCFQVLVGALLILWSIIYVLHYHERREDAKERQRTLHAINFEAL